MTPPPPRVAAIILNWRRPADTIACFESVAALDHDPLDIVLVDNASGDGSEEVIRASARAALPRLAAARSARGLAAFVLDDDGPADAPRIRIVQAGRNGGYAAGNNIGLALAFARPATRYAWILNNDTVVAPDALAALMAVAEADPAIGICGALVRYLDRRDVVQTAGGGRFRPSRARCEQIGMGLTVDALPDRATVEAELDYVNGAAALVRREAYERAGPMDEGYFLYFEEIDWAERVREAGFRMGYAPAAAVYHRVGAATGSNDAATPSAMSVYYMERSRFRFFRRRHPAVLAIAFPLVLRYAARFAMKGERTVARAMIAGALDRPFGG